MNFANLEVCEFIGAEFPESEFVWFRNVSDLNQPWIVSKRLPCNTRHEGEFYPAPTCEELGEWLHGKGRNLTSEREYNREDEKYYIKVSCWHFMGDATGHIDVVAPNETQARAEAVKLILNEVR